MGFLKKFQDTEKEATVKAFTLGEEADALGRKAAKLEQKKDKTKEESEQVKELRKQAERVRQQQEQAKALSRNMGLGEKILRCYFAYKMASLACHTLVGLAGGYGGYERNQAIGRAITGGIDRAADRLTDNIIDRTNSEEGEERDINERRAQMIEQTLESFQHMSDQAAEQGLTEPDAPLLPEADRARIQELADISRDTENPQQAELYASKAQELGLDYEEALTAFRRDNDAPEIERERENQERTAEAEKEKEAASYEMEM